MTQLPADPIRRRFLQIAAMTPLVFLFPSLFTSSAEANAITDDLPVTPACTDGDDDEITPSETEGPFFKPNSPQRKSLIENGTTGTRLTVTGMVVTRSCKPVQNALIEFWQADDAGEYDNVSYRLRGHQFTDAKGVYHLDTVIPGLYPGRTRHIHVKVQAPRQPVLTTQLYFPGEARNSRDGIFDKKLLMSLDSAAATKSGKFNFVLDLA
jgi:protocatechuate 3,4-dioxygenase beta subunit